MKRNQIFMVLLTMLVLCVPSMVSAKEIKIAYVDLSRLFDDYYKTKDYDKVLEGQHSGFEKERNDKIEKVREMQGRLGVLADDEKAKLEESIEELKAELLEFDRQKKADLTKERNEKIREILLEIEKVVSDYAKKEQYSVILNDRVLIFGDEQLDLTENILMILNKDQK